MCARVKRRSCPPSHGHVRENYWSKLGKSPEPKAGAERSSVKVDRHSWGSYLQHSCYLRAPPCPKVTQAQGRTVESHFSAKGCRPDIHFWWTTLMPFRLKLPKPQKKLHNTSAAHAMTKAASANQTRSHICALIHNTRGVPSGSISRQGVWGPQQGLGRDTQGQRDGVLFQHMLNQLPRSHT